MNNTTSARKIAALVESGLTEADAREAVIAEILLAESNEDGGEEVIDGDQFNA